MSIAAISLLILQSIWVKNSLDQNRSNFRYNVSEAISGVLIQLEKSEVIEKMKRNQKRDHIYQLVDSLNQSLSSIQIANPEVIFEEDIREIMRHYVENKEGNLILKTDTIDNGEEKNMPADNKKKEKIDNHKSEKQLRKIYRQLKEQRDQLIHKTHLMDELFQDVMGFNTERPIEQRIDPMVLDHLINKSLKSRGLKTPYEWGIYSQEKSKFIVQRTGKYPQELLQSHYVYTVFASDKKLQHNYLVLYFPEENKFLFSEVWLMLFTSCLLIIMIIFVFVYTLIHMIKQSKLTEIKNDFINNMTHEIKTPISTIALVCEALKDPEIAHTKESSMQYIDIIQQENIRLQSLSNHILEIAQLEKAQFLLNKAPTDLHAAILEAIENMQIIIAHKKGEIETHLQATKYIIDGDKVHIVNIFMNILDNANKYSPQQPYIIISTENKNKGILITISDKGIGISKHHIKKIFDKLYRVPTGNLHDVKGYGLGLSYVKTIVEKHGGSVKIESEQKKGTTFSIFFPLH